MLFFFSFFLRKIYPSEGETANTSKMLLNVAEGLTSCSVGEKLLAFSTFWWHAEFKGGLCWKNDHL